jgi:hypothetical protein
MRDFESNWLATGKVVFRIAMTNWTALDLAKVEDDLANYAQTAGRQGLPSPHAGRRLIPTRRPGRCHAGLA